jgi:transcriptional antiterminator RfaH
MSQPSLKHLQPFEVRPETKPTAAWYLVHTKPRQEIAALTNLRNQGYECYLPKMRIERVRRSVASVGLEPMFPRYLFIRLETGDHAKSWSPIRSTPGVSQLVRFGDRPAKVDDRLIELLQWREQSQPVEELFRGGDRVIITEGSFAGIEAIYQAPSAEHRALILLELLSRPITVRVQTGVLRKVE